MSRAFREWRPVTSGYFLPTNFPEEPDNKGPMEEAGEAMDDSIEETGDAIEDATDRD